MSEPLRRLRPDDLGARAHAVDRPTALISIDVESDYSSRQYEALDRITDFTRVVRRLGLPVTAFVEGQFFSNRPAVCEALLAAGVDVQLHCYDHVKEGDDLEDLGRSVEAYTRFVGRRPAGYRAHSFRLTLELTRALIDAGFAWDSSVLAGLAYGGNRERGFRAGDYFVIGERLIELPLATWRPTRIPLSQSYRLLLKGPGEAAFRRLCRYPRLLVYDMHMTDLVWSSSLKRSPIPAVRKILHRYKWVGQGSDTFASLERFVRDLKARSYRLMTINQFYGEVAATALGARSGTASGATAR